jgi:hypothetical protein
VNLTGYWKQEECKEPALTALTIPDRTITSPSLGKDAITLAAGPRLRVRSSPGGCRRAK